MTTESKIEETFTLRFNRSLTDHRRDPNDPATHWNEHVIKPTGELYYILMTEDNDGNPVDPPRWDRVKNPTEEMKFEREEMRTRNEERTDIESLPLTLTDREMLGLLPVGADETVVPSGPAEETFGVQPEVKDNSEEFSSPDLRDTLQ